MRKNKLAKTAFSILLSISLFTLKAQDTITVSDLETWTSLSIEKKFLNKKLNLNLTQEFRFDKNSSHLNVFFTEGLIDYKIINNLRLGFGYRFIRDNNDEDGFINKQRFNIDLGYNYKINRLKLSSRLRYQNKSEIRLSNAEDDYPINKYRFRIKGSYNINNWKFDPCLSSEIFYAKEICEDYYIDEIIKRTGFQKIRLTLGTSYKIKKLGSLKLFYRIEQEFKNYSNVYNIPATYHILGLNFKISL